MPALSWNEIRQNAIQFSREWKGVGDERAEAQTFWNEFFQVFGIRRRTIASFEEPVRSIKGSYGRIDLFWRGRLLVEHKSKGQSLDRAESQANRYIQDLAADNRNDEIPRYIVVSDFARIVLYDLEPDDQGELFRGLDHSYIEFQLDDLHKNIRHFAFLIGQKTHRFGEEDPANLEAAQIMADLHDVVEDSGYPAHDLERLLVRILFCLFADDTGIFELGQFELYIDNRTRKDGSDLGQQLSGLFAILNTPVEERLKTLEEDLAAFPYVNGDLFDGRLTLSAFNRDMRNRLVAACRFEWSRISPAIFGSLFQGIMKAKDRRQIGAHYTSERDILKLIRPLFLDELHAEFEQIKKDRSTRREARLLDLQKKLAGLNFLDPACGCGNFLVISYRELRRLELEVLKILVKQRELDVGETYRLSKIDVDQFYGIEIGEWPARIAETALWLTDHQMNIELSLAFGNVFQRIPLRAAPHIHCGNALRIDWNDLLPAKHCSYVLGNPPFVGKAFQSPEQKKEIRAIFYNLKGCGNLDYVTCWYGKAAQYTKAHEIKSAFVSTNSITQGEQVAILWRYLFQAGLKINFAHRTFAWKSEAKGAAHVHVVVIGFSYQDSLIKTIFEYEDTKGEPQARIVSNINPYLVEGSDLYIDKRTNPIVPVSEMIYGSKPVDGGNLILSEEEFRHLRQQTSGINEFLRPFVGSVEFINSRHRWCIWLHDVPPHRYNKIRPIQERIARVREFRLASKKARTRQDAQRPYEFSEIRQPSDNYLLVPEVSSERRDYIPIGHVDKSFISSNLAYVIPNATQYEFGVLTSTMHMAWMRQVCGRLESRYRYSAKLVYNNFPWPVDATAAQKGKVEACAQAVLDARQGHLDGGSTLADLYDPLYMPGDLLKAHHALDRAVDRCYRAKKFDSERERVEYLFTLYEKLTTPLATTAPVKKKRGRKKKAK